MIDPAQDTAPEGDRALPGVGAVIVNYNGGQRVLNTLQALLDQDCRPERVMVVDNGSSDGSPARIRDRFAGVELLALRHNAGLPAARNAGLAAVTTDWVLLLDHDVCPAPDCLRRLVAACREEDATMACPRVRLHPQRHIVQAEGAAAHFIGTMVLRHGYRPATMLPAVRARVQACIGACMLIHRRRVIEAGGFDELFFFYLEDLEFGLRLSARGHVIVCEPQAEVFHDRGDATPELSFRGAGRYPKRRAYFTMRHRLLVMLIHYRWRTLLMLAPVLALYEASMVAVAAGRGWLWQWCRAWGWLAGNAGIIRQRRRAAQAQRKVADRDLLVGGPLPFAPGFLRSGPAHLAARVLSGVCNAYWRMVNKWLG